MEGLEVNPSDCRFFEANVFRRERCMHCGHGWRLHRGAISDAAVQTFVGAQRQQAGARAAADTEARARAQARRRGQRAVEDGWLFDGGNAGVESSSNDGGEDSDNSGDFRMFCGRDLDRAPIQRPSGSGGGAFRRPRVVNLIDFSECDVPADPPPRACAPARAPREEAPAPRELWLPLRAPPKAVDEHAPHSNCGSAADTPPTDSGTPWRSKEDALAEEIQYLRQMLADSTGEIFIVRDELGEKQRMLDAVVQQGAKTDAKLRRKLLEKEEDLQKLHAELHRQQALLAWWQGCDETAAAIAMEPEVAKWERDLREATPRSLARLADRRLELRVAAVAAAASDAASLCKAKADVPRAIRIGGCTGHWAKEINGLYTLASEKHRGRPQWQKQSPEPVLPDTRLRCGDEGQECWGVSWMQQTGQRCLLLRAAAPGGRTALEALGPWQVAAGGPGGGWGWEAQGGVSLAAADWGEEPVGAGKPRRSPPPAP